MDNPYQAPDAKIDSPLPSLTNTHFYKDPGTLTRVSRIALFASMLGSLASIFSDFRQRGYLRNAESSGMSVDEAWAEMPLNMFWVYVAILAVTIAVIVFLAMWIYRMTYNARALLGASRLEYSPGWAVGWYFVPFANLWKPYQAFRDVWISSFEGISPRRNAGSGPLPLWWTLWVAYNLISNGATRIGLKADTFDDEYLSLTLNIVSETINIPLCLIFLYIVNKLYRRQTELHAKTS